MTWRYAESFVTSGARDGREWFTSIGMESSVCELRTIRNASAWIVCTYPRTELIAAVFFAALVSSFADPITLRIP